MSSRRLRRAAARANVKNSIAPVTPLVQTLAVSPNLVAATRLAASVCLSNENRADFIRLHQGLVGEHSPVTFTEHLLVDEMAVARWHQQRVWTIQTYLVENQMDRMTDAVEKEYVAIHEATRITLAYRELTEKSPTLQSLQRHESRLSRQVERCRKQLQSLRSARAASQLKIEELQNVPIEPNPGNEHCLDAAQRAESTPENAQPIPAAGHPGRSASPSPQPPPALAEFYPRSERNDSPASAATEGDLPRAA